MTVTTARRLLLLFCLLGFPVLSYAQQPILHNNQLKFSPIKMLDPINPGLELSYERRYGQLFSTQLSVAYLKDFFNTTSYYNNDDYKGYRVGLEEKFFLRKAGVVQPYAALDVVYAHTSFHDIEDFKHRDNNGYNSTYTDTFSVDKMTLSVNGKFGLQIIVKHFVVETSLGIGVKYRDATHGDRLYPKDYFDHSDDVIPTAKSVAAREGHYYTLNVPFYFKLGYVF